MTHQQRVSRWSRRFVLVGAAFLVCWQVVVLAGGERQAGLLLGLLGFVFHTIFGKAYSLVPTYFDRTLATTRLLPLHLVFASAGTILLAFDAQYGNTLVGQGGAVLWASGVIVFLATLGWTLRDNLSGRETGTSEASANRRGVDRVANLFVPLALAYLAFGTYELVAATTVVPPVFDGYAPRAVHLLATGTGALLVFALGFRLLPRFLVASPPRPLVWVVLSSGAVAPVILAASLPAGRWFRLGALLQSVAVVGFAVAVWVLYARSDRRRVGFYGVLACTVAGIAGIGLGVVFAFDQTTVDLVAAHRRLNVGGFLGLAIVGVSYQFYPPTVSSLPRTGDRTALAAVVLIFAGVLFEAAALAVGLDAGVPAGQLAVLIGACLHLSLLVGVFYTGRRNG